MPYGSRNGHEAEIVVLFVNHQKKGREETHRIALQVEKERSLLLRHRQKRGGFWHVLE